MGLVQQEPTLFNYSITENILYGKDNATNAEIKESAEIANAIEFIENQEFADAMSIGEDAISLEKLLASFKDDIIKSKGIQKFEMYEKVLQKLKDKEKAEGLFRAHGDFDEREESLKKTPLHKGF